MSRSYTSSPPWRRHGVAGQRYFFAFTVLNRIITYLKQRYVANNNIFSYKIFSFNSHVLLCYASKQKYVFA
jgi:hypothetical protein